LTLKCSEQQQRFVDCLLADPDRNAKAAAIKAGYSKKTASSQASQLMANPKVQALIEHKDTERVKRTEVDQDYVIYNLVEAMEMAKGTRPITITKNDNGKQVVEKVRKTNLTAMNKAAELLGRHLGMFVDKQELTAQHTLATSMTDIAKRNASQRVSLLPKDNIDFDDEPDTHA
jgi:phage terminase small subunit